MYPKVKAALAKEPIKVFAGEKALESIVELDTIDIVLTAVVGTADRSQPYAPLNLARPSRWQTKRPSWLRGDLITRIARERE